MDQFVFAVDDVCVTETVSVTVAAASYAEAVAKARSLDVDWEADSDAVRPSGDKRITVPHDAKVTVKGLRDVDGFPLPLDDDDPQPPLTAAGDPPAAEHTGSAQIDCHPFTLDLRDAQTSSRTGRQVDLYWKHNGKLAFSFDVPEHIAAALQEHG